MPDNQVTPEKFYLEHCEGHFKDGERERARILEVVGEVSENAAVKREEILSVVGDIKKRDFNGFGEAISGTNKKVDRIEKILLGVGAAVGIAVLAVIGDLIHDNIKDRAQAIPPAVIRQLEEIVREAE